MTDERAGYLRELDGRLRILGYKTDLVSRHPIHGVGLRVWPRHRIWLCMTITVVPSERNGQAFAWPQVVGVEPLTPTTNPTVAVRRIQELLGEP